MAVVVAALCWEECSSGWVPSAKRLIDPIEPSMRQIRGLKRGAPGGLGQMRHPSPLGHSQSVAFLPTGCASSKPSLYHRQQNHHRHRQYQMPRRQHVQQQIRSRPLRCESGPNCPCDKKVIRVAGILSLIRQRIRVRICNNAWV